MNLSPLWVKFFKDNGIEALHWSSIGAGDAPDEEIMSWASQRKYVVFSEDLDFSALVALSRATEPSIIQLRATDNLPDVAGNFVVAALRQFEIELKNGAIIVIDRHKARARILPFSK